MSLNSFDRNYGMSANSREYWGGNNGFVTVVVSLPADVEIGETAVLPDGTEIGDNAAQTALSAAEYNQFMIAQILAQRSVEVATSMLAKGSVDPTAADFEKIEGNVIAFGKSGTLTADSFGITFMIERQDVLTAQAVRPGSNYPVPVEPCAELSAALGQAGAFRKKDGTPADALPVAIKVFAALPVLL
ncbi:hypothetical protein SEPL_129 [Salmonella phage SE_PL]|uniref:hypothetical protein n=1 Tax=Salmonella enterica TaxID=28901 RepID=UPI000FDF9724|nr:hypothetical protein CPT_Munch_298 [Salmonella phage Munch]EAZ2022593.1 hypothetical protein [Salmonella enterica]ECV9083727.1 hypothetical protein [Salmonella enterica subsp. enterica serovar Infantis]MCP0435682.1 hypothetical protein [Salmonella enterica subsp. enterica serovar Mbandaka]QCW18994.1 structural protein [Salmonella phage 7t3]QIG62742.1 hypothetical protein SEPL_129 [Salmonella phage SE_PL]